VLLGLPASIVVMSAVLIVQCLVFGDGGVLALGANVTNMALVSCAVGYFSYRLVSGKAPSANRRVASAAFAGWCATVAAAAGCAEQLALSGAAPLRVVLPALLGVHALIGIGEAFITALVVASVQRFRPALLDRARFGEARGAFGSGLGLAAVLALLLAPLASRAPDGLARVAEQLGVHARPAAALAAPLAEYSVPGLGFGALATLLAGALGALLIFGLCWLLALALVPRPPRGLRAPDQSASPLAAE
jgi:cobalt/nickel transport system permease protein